MSAATVLPALPLPASARAHGCGVGCDWRGERDTRRRSHVYVDSTAQVRFVVVAPSLPSDACLGEKAAQRLLAPH